MGARRRWLRGGAAARQGHAVVSGHRFLRCLPRPCRCVFSNHANLSAHCTSQPVVSTPLIQPKKRIISRPTPWPVVRPSGCRKRESDLDWDPLRRRVQEAAGAPTGWTSFIDAMEEEPHRCVPDRAGCRWCVLWQVPRPETGLAGLERPLVRQVSAWQLRNAVLAHNVTNLQAHSHRSTAT